MGTETAAPAGPPRVLVVEANARARDRIAGWLEMAGYEVLACPGPSAPTYRCMGSHTGRCALLDGAAAVVLDLCLASDRTGIGAPAWELMLLYARAGLPLVVLTGEDDPVVPTSDERVVAISRYQSRDALLTALASLLPAPAAASA